MPRYSSLPFGAGILPDGVATSLSTWSDDLATQTLQELLAELQQANDDLAKLTAGPTITLSLADPERFQVRSGVRIRNVDLREHSGDVPVYSVYSPGRTPSKAISAASGCSARRRQSRNGSRLPP